MKGERGTNILVSRNSSFWRANLWRANILVSRKIFPSGVRTSGEPKIFCRHPDLPNCRPAEITARQEPRPPVNEKTSVLEGELPSEPKIFSVLEGEHPCEPKNFSADILTCQFADLLLPISLSPCLAVSCSPSHDRVNCPVN